MNTTPTHIANAIAELKARTMASLFGSDFDDVGDFDGVNSARTSRSPRRC